MTQQDKRPNRDSDEVEVMRKGFGVGRVRNLRVSGKVTFYFEKGVGF